ncbi:transposase domain-containing protein [Dankookia sp. P2]|uniref:transposase domain-containing protein n=1 Tax=Dankookia sp. P2 TaxID=3423955 RepID=UPI003D668F2C
MSSAWFPAASSRLPAEICTLHFDLSRYFADLLTRVVTGWPNRRIEELTPWRRASVEDD